MLTKHQYHEVGKDWDIDGLDCCKTTDPGNATCVDCCYDSWQDELRTVTQKYSKVLEQATQHQNKLTFVTIRRNTYRKWVEEINNSQDMAIAICNQLELLALQSDKIWYNSCKAVNAVEILFCMVRDFFIQLDQISTQYSAIQNCINNNTDPSLVKGQGILKALDDYKSKLDIVLILRDDISKSVVAAIKLVHQIANNISTKDCMDNFDPCAKDPQPCNGEDVYYGFKTVICEWYNSFSCLPCEEEGKDISIGSDTASQYNLEGIQSDCGDDHCDLLPTFNFPMCSPSYKECVQEWLTADENEVTVLTGKLQEANKQKEALTACKNSLVKAINAVDPKTRCN